MENDLNSSSIIIPFEPTREHAQLPSQCSCILNTCTLDTPDAVSICRVSEAATNAAKRKCNLKPAALEGDGAGS